MRKDFKKVGIALLAVVIGMIIIDFVNNIQPIDEISTNTIEKAATPVVVDEKESENYYTHKPNRSNEFNITKNMPSIVIDKEELKNYHMYKPKRSYHFTVVIKKYKLLWVLMPKCASSSLRELLARMNEQEVVSGVIRCKELQNFTSLDHFSPQEAIEILTSPDWTRVAILRDPKDRLLSAYLDKEKRFEDNPWHDKHSEVSEFKRSCCKHLKKTMGESECLRHKFSFSEFVNVTRFCSNPHWNPQKRMIDRWDIINYPISMNNLQNGTERVLRHLGNDVWEKFGATGWGVNGTDPIFKKNTRHSTNATSAFDLYFDKSLERVVETEYAEDYDLLHSFFPQEHYK